jgi:nitrite reductase/ring-hydroxylating ferredoxin subunit
VASEIPLGEKAEGGIHGVSWVDIPIALPASGQTDVFAFGELELLFCNAGGTPYVVRDRCPHVKTSMKGGLIRGTILECPLHGGLMDLRDGAPKGMPIRRPGTCYPVRAAGDRWQVGLPI